MPLYVFDTALWSILQLREVESRCRMTFRPTGQLCLCVLPFCPASPSHDKVTSSQHSWSLSSAFHVTGPMHAYSALRAVKQRLSAPSSNASRWAHDVSLDFIRRAILSAM